MVLAFTFKFSTLQHRGFFAFECNKYDITFVNGTIDVREILTAELSLFCKTEQSIGSINKQEGLAVASIARDVVA